MKVTILSKSDYAGSGLRLCENLRGVGIDVDIIVKRKGKWNARFGIEEPLTINEYKNLQRRLSESDIVHFKGDWLVGDKWYGYELPAKRVYTFSGRMFRRGDDNIVCRPSHDVCDYTADFLSTFTPEMCYTKDIHLMEFPYNIFDYRFKRRDKFRILHIPSNPLRKGTSLIIEALSKITMKNVEILTPTNVPYRDMLKLKSEASIYIDQMVLPVYGNAAVEAMAQGIPTMNWDENYYPYPTPIIKPFDRTPPMIALEIERWLDWDMLEKLSRDTFEYVQKVHGGVGSRWLKIYQELC
jgi:hypothetical protein